MLEHFMDGKFYVHTCSDGDIAEYSKRGKLL